MASDTSSQSGKPSMSEAELVAVVKKELDADDERQAQVSVASAGELPRESQTGVTLDLSHRNIGPLPAGMIALIKQKVERLALSHNPRIVLPMEIGQCERLRYLNLRWNKLTQFPEAVLTLSRLEILDISRNNLAAIPDDIKRMTNLKYLAINRNQIKRLPLTMGQMNLVKLKFDENPIEFPPLDMLKSTESMSEMDKEKETCLLVKRFLKAAALRERLKANSTEDLSSTETPRPPKRSFTGGRFPVRPSIGGHDQMFPDSRASSSPPNPPASSAPQRSHSRVASSNTQGPQRPSATPLLTASLEVTRSRSDNGTQSASVRSRRQGYVPRKTSSNLGSVNETSNPPPLARSSPAPASTPSHSRAASSTSGFTFLDVGSGGESSSAAVSPIEGPTSSRSVASRKLFSLPESRNSTQPTINSIKAVKRVLYVLFYLFRPVADITQQIKGASPHRSDLTRQITTANAHVEELDRLITCVNGIIEENAELDPTLLMSIMQTAVRALRSYGTVVSELGRRQQRALKMADPFHVRCLLTVSYSINAESRNVCRVLGYMTRPVPVTSEASLTPGVWNSRTVTPTQPKHPKGRRTRVATIMPNTIGAGSVRGKASPVVLHTNGSRTNTMSSLSGATPRTDVFAHGGPSLSRSSTIRSVTTESESEDGPERGFLRLKACCETSANTLPPIRSELAARRTAAESMGYSQAAHHFHVVTTKCETTITTCTRLLNRLRLMRVTDPGRILPELEQMFKQFSKDWADFVEEFRSLTHQQPNLDSVKSALKPVHAAVKGVARILLQSSGYAMSTARAPNGYAAHAHGPPSHYSAVPVTPLGAALGPAVQATVANGAPFAQPDHYHHMMQPLPTPRSTHDRFDISYASHGQGRR